MKKIIIVTLTFFAMQTHAQDLQPTNKHFWHTVETTANPDKIWQIWTDVANWNQWDSGLKSSEMTEKFTLDATGSIISLEGRKSKFKVVDFKEGKSYTFKTNLLFGGLYVKRFWEIKNGKTAFTHEVWFSGLTGGIFAGQFGPTFRKMLPDVLNKIKEIAEKP
jgi:Polyketide cyclase / dehydrase and lipid transport